MRATVLLVTALLVVGAAAPLAAASAANGQAASGAVTVQEDDATNETDNETETAPGARLAGVASVQGAEVEGEVERRSFGLQVAAANSNASKASVVANQTRSLDERLADLREQKQQLEAARANGTISESRYRAEMAGLAARISTVQRLTNETAETARSLPADVLADRGVNVSALERLRTSAANLTGPEVAAIARDIAGPPGNDTRGPPFSQVGNGTAGPPTDTPATPGDGNETADNETSTGDGNAPDTPGNGPDAPSEGGSDDGNNTTTTAGAGDTPGNSSGASGNGPGANTTSDPGPPSDPGNGNGNGNSPLVDLSVLASLLP